MTLGLNPPTDGFWAGIRRTMAARVCGDQPVPEKTTRDAGD
jgi:hypothetical protein